MENITLVLGLFKCENFDPYGILWKVMFQPPQKSKVWKLVIGFNTIQTKRIQVLFTSRKSKFTTIPPTSPPYIPWPNILAHFTFNIKTPGSNFDPLWPPPPNTNPWYPVTPTNLHHHTPLNPPPSWYLLQAATPVQKLVPLPKLSETTCKTRFPAKNKLKARINLAHPTAKRRSGKVSGSYLDLFKWRKDGRKQLVS